ncbi:hypothetical protein HK103_005023 [Boothiomyces macroporosus]|uniref:Uncharacterized protein n=1 Tax=Boothiomyces macroporosus TaxID=261099 RepID=A0AAD5UIP3_9FUNG|nr:hypothetical protein HK103_005023 [Boothiomyces macroporosus]KAJ3312019.1 hypothetical protein HDV04_003406 [Boothiomyces sp. JEL0838]
MKEIPVSCCCLNIRISLWIYLILSAVFSLGSLLFYIQDSINTSTYILSFIIALCGMHVVRTNSIALLKIFGYVYAIWTVVILGFSIYFIQSNAFATHGGLSVFFPVLKDQRAVDKSQIITYATLGLFTFLEAMTVYYVRAYYLWMIEAHEGGIKV